MQMLFEHKKFPAKGQNFLTFHDIPVETEIPHFPQSSNPVRWT